MTISRFTTFLAVGGAGFLVDVTGLWIGIEIVRLPPVPARLAAFAATIAFTYFLNRATTFADRPHRGIGQAVLYAIVSVTAGIANIATFVALLYALPPWRFAPYVAMPAGVAVGLVINFTLYSFAVFRPHR